MRTLLGSVAVGDVDEIDDAGRIGLISDLDALKSAAAAAQARLTATFEASRRAEHAAKGQSASRAWRHIGAAIGLARRESPADGDRRIAIARTLVHDLPHAMAALSGGWLSEQAAGVVVRETRGLDPQLRGQLDARLAGLYPESLTEPDLRRAVRRMVFELDPDSAQARFELAPHNRRVTLRPARDGMAYLSIYGRWLEVKGARDVLAEHATAVTRGRVPEDQPSGRTHAEIMTDVALAWLSGRTPRQGQPVMVNLVITDRALAGCGDPNRPINEPAHVPGYGPVPADVARVWAGGEPLLSEEWYPGEPESAAIFLRRIFTSPEGRDLVGVESKARYFPKPLRDMIVLRDERCRSPFCRNRITDVDHVRPHHAGGRTSYRNAQGLCSRCNQTKESPDWWVVLTNDLEMPGIHAAHSGHPPGSPHTTETITPTGHHYTSTAPPILGWGWSPPEDAARGECLVTLSQSTDPDPSTDPSTDPGTGPGTDPGTLAS